MTVFRTRWDLLVGAVLSVLCGVAIAEVVGGETSGGLTLVAGAVLALIAACSLLAAAAKLGEVAVRHLVVLLWFVLPWTGLKVTGFLLADVVVVVLAATLLMVGSPRSVPIIDAIRHPAGIGLLLLVLGGVIGVLFGRGGGAQLSTILSVGPAAVLTYVVVTRVTPDQRLIARLLAAWTAGALTSILLGLFLLRRENNARALGLAAHPNQFAMVSVMTLPMLYFLRERSSSTVSTVVYALGGLSCVAAILESGSRSGLIALGVVGSLILLRAYRNTVLTLLAVLLVGGLVVLGLTTIEPVSEGQSAVERVMGGDAATASNEARLAALQEHVERGARSSLVGSGFPSSERAHSAVINVWSSAGLLGVLGLALVVLAGADPALRGLNRRRHPEVWVLSASFIGYLTVAMINNVLWNRFVWAHLAILVVASMSRRGDEPDSPSGVRQDGPTSRVAAPAT